MRQPVRHEAHEGLLEKCDYDCDFQIKYTTFCSSYFISAAWLFDGSCGTLATLVLK
jgi:hypothetical protein